MITDKEIAEFKTLHNTLSSLHDKFLERRQELRRILEETFALKKEAYLVLANANRLTRHLTSRQRQLAGLCYHLNEIKARVHSVSQNSQLLQRNDTLTGESLPEIRAGFPEECRNRWELKQKGLILLALIDRLKKNLLQLDILELRCRELILSINKAIDAFRHESRIIHRKLFRFGFLSLLYRSLCSLWGKNYFSPGELGEISALGAITGYVLKIADSPVI